MADASFGFDHLVVAVSNLQAAVDDYTELGFKVTPGGRHTHAPTRNALIYFRDGAYIELIEWLEPAPGDRWYERVARRGEGIIDFALCPSAFPGGNESVRNRYRSYRDPVPGSRVQADGEEIRWLLGWPKNDVLPFLCADVTPRVRRVPQGECCDHPNGASGVRSVSIDMCGLDAAVAEYEWLLGFDAAAVNEAETKSGQEGVCSTVLSVGSTNLCLSESAQRNGASHSSEIARDHLTSEMRISRVDLISGRAGSPFTLDEELTHGAPWWIA